MSDKPVIKPLAIAVGTAIVTSLASVNTATAAENPFAMTELSSGYMVAEMAEGKCGEGKCGGAKATEDGKCGEGKCGMKTLDADSDGSITREEFMQGHEAMFGKMDANSDGVIDADEQEAGMKAMKEGKCGEGKCGGAKAADEAKSMKEGKCGEGKCGGAKAVDKAKAMKEGKCGEGKCGGNK
jgi:uncharacterized low-complexity protein